MANKESKLTTLASKVSSKDLGFLSQKSINWLTKEIRQIRNPSRVSKDISREGNRHHSLSEVKKGELFFYFYDPKYANTLPYYDTFPLVLVLEKYPDGILGLNLHYLPIQVRAAFMDKLMQYVYYDSRDEINSIRVTYEILKTSSKYKEFKPCIKRYLTHQMGSSFLKIFPTEWETALFLPVQSFKKATQNKVWRESVQSYKGS